MQGETMIDVYEQTLKNCEFYEKEQKFVSLANEIGVLRGIAYCLEIVGVCPHDERYAHFIDVQNQIKAKESEI